MANGSVALPRTLGRRLGSLPIALGGALGFIVCYGLNHSWKATLGAVFNKLSEISIPTGVFGALHPLGFLKTASDAIEKWFSDAQKFFEKGMVWGFTNFAMFWVLIGAAAFVFGEAIFELGEWTGAYISKVIRAQHLSRVIPTITKLAREANARLDAQLRTIRHSVAHLTARVAHLSATIPRSIAHADSYFERLLKQGGSLRARTRELERLLTAAGAIGLVTLALKRMKLGWLRCPALLRMGNKLGCAGFGWAEAFFATAFEALVVLDLCRFALGAQKLAKLIVPQLASTLLVQNAVCLGGGASYPSAHDSPKTATKILLPSAHD